MAAIFGKLNLKQQRDLLVVDAPASFEPELVALGGAVRVHRTPQDDREVQFVLVFATRLQEVEAAAAWLTARAPGDPVVWFAYPKGTSKRYRCDFNRDSGWASLGAVGFEPVRQVAIDEDWTALRFRRVEHIRVMLRAPAGALTEAGRARTAREPER